MECLLDFLSFRVLKLECWLGCVTLYVSKCLDGKISCYLLVELRNDNL